VIIPPKPTTQQKIEIEGGMNLPDFDDWLDDMLEGGRVQHPGEVDDDHHLVEEGAAGCLEQGGHERERCCFVLFEVYKCC
jgi:hypothetical protein